MFIDSSAWVEYFAGGTRGQKVRERLEQASIAFTSATVLAEVYSKYTRSPEAAHALERVDFIQGQAALVELDAAIGVAAGRIHAQEKRKNAGFSMSDAFILAAARARNSRLITFDSDFEGIVDADVLD